MKWVDQGLNHRQVYTTWTSPDFQIALRVGSSNQLVWHCNTTPNLLQTLVEQLQHTRTHSQREWQRLRHPHHTHTYMHAYTNITHTHTHAHTRAHTHTHANKYTQPQTHAHVHIYIHAPIHSHTHLHNTCIHTRIHKYTCAHTHTQTMSHNTQHRERGERKLERVRECQRLGYRPWGEVRGLEGMVVGRCS